MSKKRTKEAWESLCKEWEVSGQRQPEYCKNKGIPLSSFKAHRSQMREAEKKSGCDFSELVLREETVAEAGLDGSSPYCTIQFKEMGSVVIESAEAIRELRAMLWSI